MHTYAVTLQSLDVVGRHVLLGWRNGYPKDNSFFFDFAEFNLFIAFFIVLVNFIVLLFSQSVFHDGL